MCLRYVESGREVGSSQKAEEIEASALLGCSRDVNVRTWYDWRGLASGIRGNELATGGVGRLGITPVDLVTVTCSASGATFVTCRLFLVALDVPDSVKPRSQRDCCWVLGNCLLQKSEV